MGTVATAQLRNLGARWRDQTGLTKATMSGIVGDLAHKAKGGYHISRQDQPTDNYSVVRPDDKPGNGRDDAASAIDMTMNAADMIKTTKRLISAYDNLEDPRRKYLNAFNGTTDGKTARRWDVYARQIKTATSDHLWHVHLEVRRKYSDSDTAVKAILSLLSGESVDAYLISIGAKKPTLVAPPYPGRVLKRTTNMQWIDVELKKFVGRMLERGWQSFGVNDGVFGPKVEAGVKKWQTYLKIGVDGQIGPQTWPTPWTKPMA